MNNPIKVDNFCKACGSLSKMGICPQGHDSTLTDKIKKVAHAEDGLRVLISVDNKSLGNEFWTYECHHKVKVFIPKSVKNPPYDVQLTSSDAPCKKLHEYGHEDYHLKDILPTENSQPADDDYHSPCGAAATLENRMGGINYKH